MRSRAKTGKIFIGGSQEQKTCTFLGLKHKSAIWDRTPTTYTSNLVYMCAGGFRGHKSSNRIELSWFVQDLFVIFLIWVSLALGGGAGEWGVSVGWPTIVYMCSGMFRGKESSNRIEISWLVQNLLNFGLPAALRRVQVGGDVSRGILGHGGCPHTCTHACTHKHTHMYMHAHVYI